MVTIFCTDIIIKKLQNQADNVSIETLNSFWVHNRLLKILNCPFIKQEWTMLINSKGTMI